eukprot:TRINITY_DN20652_c1_g1_i1.p1 TRINITY_DN20652_c1_g1~~TRINITY_DN20652_c1_g1_i1.p1  ORF type:complete len:524 (-),score=76.60 TRINITY_DN20652_c1_g1_i1:123-1694(-)
MGEAASCSPLSDECSFSRGEAFIQQVQHLPSSHDPPEDDEECSCNDADETCENAASRLEKVEGKIIGGGGGGNRKVCASTGLEQMKIGALMATPRRGLSFESGFQENCFPKAGFRFQGVLPLCEAQTQDTNFTEVIVPHSRPVDMLPRGPKRPVPTYSVNESIDLKGELRSGVVAHLKLGEKIQRVWLTIYQNGFSLGPSSGSNDPVTSESTMARAWSPFTLIEMCQVQAKRQEHSLAVFKLTILRKDVTDLFFYFGCCGPAATTERDSWLQDIAGAIGRVTLSVIPSHQIAVRPVRGVPGTVTRLMAGYMVRLVEAEVVALCYCELQAYAQGTARIVLYSDEWCEHEFGCVPITDTSVVSTRKGDHCTVLGIDSHLLCARTWKEKELWLRAVSNVKVKLMFDAPAPTEEELAVYRSAVLERLESDQLPQESIPVPLLERVGSKVPWQVLQGDNSQPESMESPTASVAGSPRSVDRKACGLPAVDDGDDDDFPLIGPGPAATFLGKGRAPHGIDFEDVREEHL